MSINSKTVFFFAQAVAKDMMKRKYGKIINIASLLAFQGGIIVPSYAASKGAVAQVTKALANEWAKEGITVNAIAPGYMATNNTKALREDPVRSKAILDRIPAARWGTPEDLAGTAVFLASSASDYINGHVLVVDGGWLAR
jgi:2-deoxy-D-gluconate 3-dehydrogenase